MWGVVESNTAGGQSSAPDWEAWAAKCEVYRNCAPHKKKANLVDKLEHPVQLPVRIGKLQLKDDQSVTLLNVPAAQFITTGDLYARETWVRLLATQPPVSQDISQIAPTATIVKEIWEYPQPCAEVSPTCAYLNVWVRSRVPRVANGEKVDQVGFWNDSVLRIDLNPHIKCGQTNLSIIGTKDIKRSTPAVPISCFHSLPTSDGKGTGGILDRVVLVGFHVTLGDVPNWSWGTFWLTAQPDVDGFDADKPKSLCNKAPWRYFSMDATRSTLDKNDKPKTVFNPYLEGTMDNGLSTNCLFCHRRAIFRNSADYLRPAQAGGQPRSCAYARPKQSPNLCPDSAWIDSDKPDDPTAYLTYDPNFKDSIQTHFLWSMAFNPALRMPAANRAAGQVPPH